MLALAVILSVIRLFTLAAVLTICYYSLALALKLI